MSPIPSTSTFHPLWSEHHYTTVRGSLTASGRILRRGEGEGVFDPVTGNVTPPANTVVYDGPMRVQELVGGGEATAGDENLAITNYRVVIEHDASPIRAGQDEDWVIVDTCPDDAQLVGTRLSIQSVTYGSQRWERDLLCQLDQTRKQAS